MRKALALVPFFLIAAMIAGCSGSVDHDPGQQFPETPNLNLTGTWRQVSASSAGITQNCPGRLLVPIMGGGTAVDVTCYSGDTVRFETTGRATYTLNGGLYAQGTYVYDPTSHTVTVNFEFPSPNAGSTVTVPAQISFDGTTKTAGSPFVTGVTAVLQRQ